MLQETEHVRLLRLDKLVIVKWQQPMVIIKYFDILFDKADISMHLAISHVVCCPGSKLSQYALSNVGQTYQ